MFALMVQIMRKNIFIQSSRALLYIYISISIDGALGLVPVFIFLFLETFLFKK